VSVNVVERAKEIRNLLDAQRRKSPGYQDMQRLLNRYATERFLYRLGQSRFENLFVLKGAMLLAIYLPDAFLTTQEVEFLLSGAFTQERLKQTLREVCAIKHEDGLTFPRAGISVQAGGSDREAPGCSAVIPARLGASNCNIHLEIRFGEAVTPSAQRITFPSLLDLPRPELRAYTLETVVAEKFQAIVHLGMSNTRLKDYHDLAEIARYNRFDGELLRRAMIAAFERRRTPIPIETPLGLGSLFFGSKQRQTDWRAFLKRHGLSKRLALEDVCRYIEVLVMPVAQACVGEEILLSTWRQGAWQHSTRP
jgi:hypothetical protein